MEFNKKKVLKNKLQNATIIFMLHLGVNVSVFKIFQYK